MAIVKTVEIHHPESPEYRLIINESDYQPDFHHLWGSQVTIDSIDSTATEDTTDSAITKDARSIRLQELETIYQKQGWGAISRIANSLGIRKPDNGWYHALPAIVDAEFNN